jgi:CheY-like chemotaxis protein
MALKILLAEDDPNDMLLFQWALKRAGLDPKVRLVTSGQEVMELLSRFAASVKPPAEEFPDILFLDLKMPMINGFEVLQWLAQHPEIPPLPVVVLSGSNMPADLERAATLGAKRFIEKPIPSDLLREVLATSTIKPRC